MISQEQASDTWGSATIMGGGRLWDGQVVSRRMDSPWKQLNDLGLGAQRYMMTVVWFRKELISEKFQQIFEQAIEEKKQILPVCLPKWFEILNSQGPEHMCKAGSYSQQDRTSDGWQSDMLRFMECIVRNYCPIEKLRWKKTPKFVK